MSDLDVTVVDEYARHLARVNERNEVVASEDIYNAKGVLLVRKGTKVCGQLADKIIRHKLVQPLEHSVNLTNVIDHGRLIKAFRQLFDKFPDLAQIHEALRLELLLDRAALEYTHYPLLTQKFTVLAMERPHDYQKALFSAWLGLAIAKWMKLPVAQINEVFLAGLVHDTGMLHISREILDKKGQLTTEEWRTIQSHPKIGELFLRHVPDLPGSVPRATLEHHERSDGTGYPQGLFGDELSLEGQITAVADSIAAIRMLRMKREGENLAHVIPVLQLNARIYEDSVWRAAVSVIRAGGLKIGRLRSDEEIPNLIAELIEAHDLLSRCFEGVGEVMRLLPEDVPVKALRTAAIQLHNSWFAVSSSGLLSPVFKQILQNATENDNEGLYDMVEELALMLRELSWQFAQLRKVLHALHDDHILQGDADELLLQSFEKMKALDKVEIH